MNKRGRKPVYHAETIETLRSEYHAHVQQRQASGFQRAHRNFVTDLRRKVGISPRYFTSLMNGDVRVSASA